MRARRSIYIFLIFLMLACSSGAKYKTVKVVKPVNRNRFYKPGKDKRKKRVKYVKKKILVRSVAPKPPKSKPVKEKKVESDSLNTAQPDSLSTEKPIPNEQDTTGLF